MDLVRVKPVLAAGMVKMSLAVGVALAAGLAT